MFLRFVLPLVAALSCLALTAPAAGAQSATPTGTRTITVTPPRTATATPPATFTPRPQSTAGRSPSTTPSSPITATRTATPGSALVVTPPASPSPTASPTAAAPFNITGRPLDGLIVALDPGHGGRDPGALYHGLRESDVNLATALLTRPLLQEAGARVTMTRDRDVLVGPADGTITQDLQARAQIANRAGAHVFVSIHANVHSDENISGAITFLGPEEGYAGSQRRSAMQVDLSRLLAAAVQQGVVSRTGEIDRGVRVANFWVLGATSMPSVLLEAGFLTNAAEARNLADPAFRRRIAEGITSGIITYVTQLRSRDQLPTDPVLAVRGQPGVTYFERTGHNLAYGFRHFFDTYGGLDIFGFPRTEEIMEDGWTVQYFQRARFEYHPEHAGTPYEVQIGLVGDAVTAGRRPFPAGAPFASSAEHRWYPETGHGLHYGFLNFFSSRGGLDVFGYPISEELTEVNDDGSGRGYTVQYFQRARFEYHPEHAGTTYEVQLGLLGDELLRQRGWLC